ncbi:hypothetical protein [Sphingomonas oryzagri]|uniref:Uncharacterized protein n=1 Tax=Sphingomonas oryzagri TaxID=3042314 RepID=A0ABT6N6I8_9SPHN|nr:hypothetical protein [Sphingomonas oryzagri]MDH7640713.1 hypothetical protein [Sphingomonas oryzagri]
MQPPMDPASIRDVASGRSVDDVLAIWQDETAEHARSDDWIAIAFEIARRMRTGCA